MTETYLTRKELYDLIWSQSMRSLAQKFGISDRGLAKICERYKIPRPGLGYWAKLEHGKLVTKKPLPKDTELDKEKIIINPKALNVLMQKGKKRGVYLKEQIPLTTNLDDLSQIHPLIKKAYKAGFRETSDHGFFRVKRGPLSICVGENNQNRALCILDTLFKATISRGYAVKVLSEKEQYSDYTREYIVFEIKGESIRFYLREKSNRIDHVFTKEEKERDESYRRLFAPKYDYIPSGKLEFVIDAGLYDKPSWKDGEKIKLEDKIGHLVKGILKAADACKKRRIRDNEYRIQQAKEEKRRREAEERRQEEQKRIQNLEVQVENWQKSRHIRDFLIEAEKVIIQKRFGYDQDSDFDQWLKWARAYADLIDPLHLTE